MSFWRVALNAPVDIATHMAEQLEPTGHATSWRSLLHESGPLLLLLSVLFLVVWLAPPSHAFEGASKYLPLHSFMETFAVVVAVLVFGIGWHAYSAERSGSIVILACAFLAVGLLDFAHMLSYAGMPDFVSPSGPQKAIDFWLAARFLAAAALLAVALLPWRPFPVISLRYLWLAGGLIYTATVYWVVLYHEELLPETFIAGQGLTAIKVGAEYAIVLIHLLTLAVWGVQAFRQQRVPSAHLVTAVAIMMLSELCFTLYSSVTDIFNLLGHVYKVLAYIFIYRAVFVDSVRAPYNLLRQSERAVWQEKERAQVTLKSIGDGVITTDDQGVVQYLNPVAEKLCGWLNAEAQGRSVLEVFNVIGEGARQALKNPALECLRLGQVVSLTNHTLLLRRDGGEVHIEDSAAPIRNHDGAIIGAVLVFHDVTERMKVLNERERLSSILEATPDFVAISTLEGQRVYLNRAGRRMLGIPEDQDVTGLLRQHAYPAWIWDFIKSEAIPFAVEHGVWRGESVVQSSDGREIPVSQVIIAHKDGDGHIRFISTIARDISERKRFEAQLLHQANHDALTGLPNRTLFQDRLGMALAQSERSGQLVGVMMLDLNRFKTINDTLGHDVGDSMLKEVAQRLAACMRDGDTISRWGGDEFTFLLPNLNRPDDAAEIAKRMLNALSHPFALAGEEMFVGASVGITLCTIDGQTAENLIKNADVAMYRAKRQGGDAYQFFTADMNDRALERLTLENSLRKALERKELQLYYQPQVDLASGRINGMEALLRWRHPERGMVSPADFIPLAEETGLIMPIGEWVLREACRQNRAWQDAGLPRMRVCVNFSAHQLRQPDIGAVTAAILEESGLDADCLELELTESYLMQDPELAIRTLQEFKDMGITIALDDFGTGYSSLSYLKRFPIDCLKIDRSFINDIPGNADSLAIVSAINAMARSLNLKVVAEGVEVNAQLEYLKQLGCHSMQGYLFSRPVPADEFAQLAQTADMP
jgi:diguanylate cyclase (GGDEF)-like protein/PAS domain S-box-containing protein